MPLAALWGASSGSAIVIGSIILRKYLEGFYDLRDGVSILPRITSYAATLIAFPFLHWVMIRFPEGERSRPWALLACMGGGLGVGIAASSLILCIRP